MKNTKIDKLIKELREYGVLKLLDEVEIKNGNAVYMLEWNGTKCVPEQKFFKMLKGLPIMISIKNDGVAKFMTLFSKGVAYEDDDLETVVKNVNLINSKCNYTKSYVDEEGDLHSEAILNISGYDSQELEGIIGELIYGMIIIIISVVIKDEKGEE